MSVVIETTVGDITVDLFVKERPKTCLNFLKLCKLKYYNYNLFHTIEPNFLAQTGDNTGVGDKGESVWGVIEGPKKRLFEAELIPKILHSDVGLLSMVASEDGFIGSQFFFTLGTDLISLDGIHCVIGQVVEGDEILRKLNEAIVDDKHRPYKDIRITHTIVLEDPFPDPRGFREPSRSPSPSADRLMNGRIGADEDIDDTDGKTEAEVQEMLEDREAKARATILEIVGDLPDADVAPPENVLFVCKLNPVTNDDDLQIIFNRFGKIKSCEVIRDKQSNESLQYAFIEFEEQKSCEEAYFKMANVLIDDRRIHVDFSQSVSKIKWRGKGNYTIYDDDEKDGKKPKRRSREKDRNFRRSRSYEKRDNRDRNDNSYRDNRDRDRGFDNRRFDNRRFDNRRFDNRRVDDRRFDNRRPDNNNRFNDNNRYNNNRYNNNNNRNNDSRRRSRSPRRRQSPDRRNRDSSPQRKRSRSRDNSSSYRRKNQSPRRDRKEESPRRDRKEESPRRDRKDQSLRRDKKDSDSLKDKKHEKSSRKHDESSRKHDESSRKKNRNSRSSSKSSVSKQKKSSKKGKRDRSSSSSSSSNSSSESDHKNKKSRR